MCVSVHARTCMRGYVRVCAHKRKIFLSTLPSSFLSTLSPGGPWDPSAWKQNPPPRASHLSRAHVSVRLYVGGGASLFRASAKDTVEKYHNKCVLEGEAAVVLFRWLIYGRRGLHIKTVCETSSVDTN